MAKTPEVTMNGFVEYARVFESNMDDNMDFYASTQGQYNMNFYPASEAEAEKFFAAGAPLSVMGHDTLKEKNANPDLGIGKYFRLKRPNVHSSGFENYGGAPKVYDIRDGGSARWDEQEKGYLGNGTEVSVKVSVFVMKNGIASIRLEKVGVKDLVEYGSPEVTEDVF